MQPSAVLNLSNYRNSDRAEVWRSFNSGVFELEPLMRPAREINANLCCYRIGQSVIGRYAHSGNSIRSVSTTSAMQREELLVLRMHLSGSSEGIINDQAYRTSRSHLLFYDYNQSLDATNHPTEFISFTFPYAAIGYDPSQHNGLFQIDLNSPSGIMIRNNLEMMQQLVPKLSLQDAGALADGFTGLLAGLLWNDLRDDTLYRKFLAGREVAVRRFVKNNLKTPGLDADMICKSLNLSRAVLYRIYQPEGGVSHAITTLRLEGAYRDLAISEPKRGVIAQVAQSWCFFDGAHFSRLFRQTFAVTPSDAIGSARGAWPQPCNLAEPVESLPAKATRLRSLYEDAPA